MASGSLPPARISPECRRDGQPCPGLTPPPASASIRPTDPARFLYRGSGSMALEVLNQRSFGETARRDAWWVQPLVVFLGLGTFIVYSTWAAFQGAHYRFGPYISPFYSPEVFGH